MVPSAQSGLLPHLDIFDCDSYCPSRRQRRALVINVIKTPGAHWPLEFYADFTSRVIAPTSTPFETHHLPSSNVIRPTLPQPASQRRSYPVLRQNVGGMATWREGMDEWCWLASYVANRSTIACDSTHTSTFRTRYVRFLFSVLIS